MDLDLKPLEFSQLRLANDLRVIDFDPWKVIMPQSLDFSPHAPQTPNIAMMLFINIESHVYSMQVLHRTYLQGKIQSGQKLKPFIEHFFNQQTPCYGYAQNPDLPLTHSHQFSNHCQVLISSGTKICSFCQNEKENSLRGMIMENEESKTLVLDDAFQSNQVNDVVEELLDDGDQGNDSDLFPESDEVDANDKQITETVKDASAEIANSEKKPDLSHRRSSRRIKSAPINYNHLLNDDDQDDDKELLGIPKYLGEQEEEEDFEAENKTDSEEEEDNVARLIKGPYKATFPQHYEIKPVSEDDPRVLCPICNRYFKDTKTFRSHYNFHGYIHQRRSAPIKKKPSKYPKLFCSHCDAQFRLPKALAKHLKRDHNPSEEELKKVTENKLQCWICSEIFANKNLHEQHKKREHLIGKWQCLFCNDVLRHGLEVVEHYEASHRRSNFKINCVLCHEEVYFLEGFQALQSHWKVCYNRRVKERMAVQKAKQKNSEKFKHICDQCGRMFRVRTTLLEHQDEHKGIFKHCCTECNYRTAFKQRLVLHCKVRHSPNGKRVRERNYVPCEICGKIVSDASLSSHNARAHSEPTWPCDQCDKAFGTSWLLKKHYHSTHPTTSVKCEVCGLFLKSKGTLRAHMLTHAPAKFSCRFCGKGLKTRLTLANHERIHTKENPYKCDQCQFACATSGNLLLHKKKKHDVQKKNFYIPALIPDVLSD